MQFRENRPIRGTWVKNHHALECLLQKRVGCFGDTPKISPVNGTNMTASQLLEGKIAIVTGAAMGIGAAGAEEMASEGASVVVVDINESAANQTVSTIESSGGKAVAVIADVGTSAGCRKAVEKSVATFGGLDILLNNVGIQPPASYTNVEDTSEEMWDRIMAVNLKSRFLMAKYSIPEMRRRGGGVIISIGSVQGQLSANLVPAYAATKGGDESLTRQMAIDYAPDNIRVLSVCPGGIDTPMLRNSVESKGLTLEESFDKIAKTVPLGMGQSVDIARVAVFLASDKASFMTGTSVNVDGGIMAKGAWA